MEPSILSPEDSAPSRQLKLSKFDSESLGATWNDEEEKTLAESTLEKMATAYRTIIGCLGDPSPNREGLTKTPFRAAKAFCFFTKGYEENLASKTVMRNSTHVDCPGIKQKKSSTTSQQCQPNIPVGYVACPKFSIVCMAAYVFVKDTCMKGTNSCKNIKPMLDYTLLSRKVAPFWF